VSWTNPAALSNRLDRLWQRGDLLRQNAVLFPLRIPIAGPSPRDLSERFSEVRPWITELSSVSHIELEWKEINHRFLGPQRLPKAAKIKALEDAIDFIGRKKDAEKFRKLQALARQRIPKLLEWLERRPLTALDTYEDWPHLLDVAEWMCRNPRPDIYLRQIDIPGLHTKFVERHRGLLSQWLDILLSSDDFDQQMPSMAKNFAERYGFRDKPIRIRFRPLDPALALIGAIKTPDVTLDAESFASLDFPVRRVFITENEINYLVFPAAPQSIVLFGAGYGWDALAKAKWLGDCNIFYWGDIDTHGFAILNQLRGHFPHANSFLMNKTILLAHREFWGQEIDQVRHDLPRLREDERLLYDELRDNRNQQGLRLEQELIGYGWLKSGLAEVYDPFKS